MLPRPMSSTVPASAVRVRLTVAWLRECGPRSVGVGVWQGVEQNGFGRRRILPR